MLLWLLTMVGSGSGAVVPPVVIIYTPGILHPIVDTAGDFSTANDPDRSDVVTDPVTSLNPVD